MANQKTVKDLQAITKAAVEPGVKVLQVGDLIRATHATDGTVIIKEALSKLKLVDVADVDLLLTFANGDHIIIPNGALDALGTNPPNANFSDATINLSELFKLVGIANPAKAGSLRLVSENIDANPPSEHAEPLTERIDEVAPAAPMVKVGAGTSSGAGKGPGNGLGAGEGEGEVPATVVPLVTAQPSVYRVGANTQSVQDLLNGLGLGSPNANAALYTSAQYKVTPSGRSDLPLGAYDPAANTSELVERASPTKQSTVELINGTSSADNINFNPSFSSGEGQWSKTLHIAINNFSSVNSIQLIFNASRIAQIPGFNLVSNDPSVVITRDSPTSNSWHITPTPDMLFDGVNVDIVYDINDIPNDVLPPVDFGADVIVSGNAGPLAFEVVNNLNFTWRDAVTVDDFDQVSLAGNPLMVLPRAGVGVLINAGDGDDVINAGAGPDLILGGNGNDTIHAGTGNDTLNGGIGADVLDGGAGSDVATYENATAFVVASLTDPLINVGEAAGDTYNSIENLTGSAYSDTLIGNSSANKLSGGDGNDTLEGMGGADALIGGDGVNTASYTHAAVGLTVSLATPTSNTGDAFGDTFTQIQNLTGSSFNDTLIGNASANTINGGAGDDVLEGLDGADNLIGGAGNNTASFANADAGLTASLTNAGVNTGHATGDTYTQIQNLAGSAFNDTLIGDAAVNILSGANGDDTLEGMGGADDLRGDIGVDTASYANASTFVAASLTTGLAGFTSAGDASGDTFNSIENLTGSNYNDTLVGDTEANVINGGAGDDVLEGMGNADTLIGGAGNNTASYEHAAVGLTASLDNAGINTGDALGDVYTQIQNLTGSGYNDILVGDSNNNALIGGNGDDLLEGMAGADALNGGAGVDTATYSRASLGVVASLTPSLVMTTNDASGDSYNSIENLTGSNYADTLIGDGASNTLSGSGGDDVLEGMGGADVLLGGTGNNTASYAYAAVGLTVSLANSASNTGDATGDIYSNIQNITGSRFSDNITGDGGSNILTGGDGDDVLEGMENADILNGGSGTDTATYANSSTFVAASLTAGLAGFTSAGDAGGDVFNSVENLTGSSGNDTLIGDSFVAGVSSGVNILSGGAGNDVLEGMGGADVLDGGAGNNTASYERSADQGAGVGVTASLASPATNTADALGDTYINIQNLTGSAFNDTLTGDANNNILVGGAGNDSIIGGAGTDALYGGDGDDNLSDDNVGAGIIDAGAGNDIITLTNADSTNDVVTGGSGIDTLIWNSSIGATRVDFDLKLGTMTYQFGGFGVKTNFTGIENVTATANNSTYVYANNENNIIVGGSTTNDWVDYRYATGGINANLATGIVTGGSGNDTLTGINHLYAGSYYDDVLIGDAGDNWIRGITGNDVIDGGAGTDTWYIDWNGDMVVASLLSASQNAAMGIVMTGDAAGDTVTNMENLYAYYSANGGAVYGNELTNALYGNGLIEGFVGNDYLYGWLNTATASYANAGNAYLASLGITTGAGIGVTATLTTSFSVGPAVVATGDAAGDTYNNVLNNLQGSAFDDTLIGNANVNILTGGNGNDVLEGLGGGDTFNGGNGSDWVSYTHSTAAITVDLQSRGTYTPTGDAVGDIFNSIENVIGSNYNDRLYGTGSDNILIGGAGDDLLDGDNGTDTADYSTATSGITINLTTNTVSGTSTGTDTLVSIERIIGTNFVDTYIGTAGNDVIDGGAGADNIDGGAGSDTVSYASATGARSVTLGGANTDGDTLTSIENIIGSAYGDILTGDANDNVIEGGLGDDTMNGGGNTAAGDTASYANATNGVNVSLAIAGAQATGVGNDTLSNFENLLGSTYDDTLTGDGNNNVLEGGDGNDTLIGGGGADTLRGGVGMDTVSYANALSAVAVTINGAGTLGDANGDILTAIENLTGSAFNDTLTGDGAANLIIGGLGDDSIDGAGGADTVSYLAAASAVTANLSNLGVNVIGGAGNDSLTSVENLVGSNFDDTLTGDGGNNSFEGGAGADMLDGGTGNDTVVYATSNAGVSVSLAVATGHTGGHATGDNLVGFENITGSNFDDFLTGNGLVNILDGGAGNDTLIGGASGDQLIGGLGNDTVSYASSAGAVTANLATNINTGGDANGDTFSGVENLIGSNLNDTLTGDSNNNILNGGAGNDSLSGGAGDDTFIMTSGRDSAQGGLGTDTFVIDASNAANLPTYLNGDQPYTSQATVLNGGGDIIKLVNLGGTYSLTALANVTDYVEVLDVRGDATSTSLQIDSLSIQRFVDYGTNSQLWIKADSGDSININLLAGETLQQTVNGSTTDYTIFNAGTQIAQIHWQTA